MKVVYVIHKDGHWTEVSKEEYDNFSGEKFAASPWWKIQLVQDWLLQLRWR